MPQRKYLYLTEIITAAVLVLFLALCVKANDSRDDISLYEMKGALLSNVSDPENMKEAGPMKLKALYGLSANDYEEVLLYTPASNMDAQEMLVIRCRTKEQTKEVLLAMKSRIDYQSGIFESYGVDQMALIRKAKTESKGLYCIYICDKNSGKVRDAFVKTLSHN